jgi:hypothetical protein
VTVVRTAPPLLAAAFLAVLLGAQAPPAAEAHGGPPLRIGVTADPDQDALGRILLAHLRDGVGYAAGWVAFPDRAAQDAAWAGGKLDIRVGCVDADPAPGAFPLAFATGAPAPCARLGAAVARGVLEDLRFTILGEEIRKLFTALVPADLAAVRAARERGGERAAAAAARDVVAGKRLR